MMHVREQKTEGERRKQEFLNMKREQAKQEVPGHLERDRKEIEDFEMEAEQLEALEVELLQRLQETQKKERDAYGKLESAMLDTSVPMKQRVMANQSTSLAGESVTMTERSVILNKKGS
jgi:hypothetical protein